MEHRLPTLSDSCVGIREDTNSVFLLSEINQKELPTVLRAA